MSGAVAMVLAAGRGERMRPLTDHTPKPLLPVRGKPLLQWPLEALAQGGFRHIVVNTAWLDEQVSDFAAKFELEFQQETRETQETKGTQPAAATPLHLALSHEGQDFGAALETAGGIVRALPQLGEVFWVLAGDVFAPSFVFSQRAVDAFVASDHLAHLWLVPNPAHNPTGDFGLSAEGLALNQAAVKYTYSTMGLYRRALFAPPFCDIPAGNPQGRKAALAPLLRAAMDQGRVSAELFTGDWTDVGTPERLLALNQAINQTINQT
jgi:MurNAc alpha-1-phosphate uridylyltransferase